MYTKKLNNVSAVVKVEHNPNTSLSQMNVNDHS